MAVPCGSAATPLTWGLVFAVASGCGSLQRGLHRQLLQHQPLGRGPQAKGTGERDAAQEKAADRPGAHQKTIGADKNYNTMGFVAEMRGIGVTPHVTQKPPALLVTPLMGTPLPRGLCQVNLCPPRHRAGVWLDLDEVFSIGVAVGRAVPVHAARSRKGECSVRSAPDRLQPDSLGNLLRPAMAVVTFEKLPEGEKGAGPQAWGLIF